MAESENCQTWRPVLYAARSRQCAQRQETQTPVGFSFGTSGTLFKFSYNPVTAHQEVFCVVKLWGHIYHLALGILAARCSFNLQLAPTL